MEHLVENGFAHKDDTETFVSLIHPSKWESHVESYFAQCFGDAHSCVRVLLMANIPSSAQVASDRVLCNTLQSLRPWRLWRGARRWYRFAKRRDVRQRGKNVHHVLNKLDVFDHRNRKAKLVGAVTDNQESIDVSDSARSLSFWFSASDLTFLLAAH